VANDASIRLKERLLFFVLWELPIDLQLALPETIARLTLQRFAQRHPDLPPLRAWLDRAREGRPPPLSEIADLRAKLHAKGGDKADTFVCSAMARICEGTVPDAAAETVTSAAIAATEQAIGALAAWAWIDDDPEAAANEVRFLSWLETRTSPSEPCPVELRPMARNHAASDAEYAGWDLVASWLRASGLGRHAEVVNRSQLARAMRRASGDFFTVLYPGEIYRAPPSPGLLRRPSS
jgi:hypothetical protein